MIDLKVRYIPPLKILRAYGTVFSSLEFLVPFAGPVPRNGRSQWEASLVGLAAELKRIQIPNRLDRIIVRLSEAVSIMNTQEFGFMPKIDFRLDTAA